MTLLSFKDIDHFIKQFDFDKNTADLACLTITDIFNRYCPTLNWYLKEVYRLSYTMGPKKYSRTYIFKIDSKDINWQTVKGIMTINTNVDSDSEQCGEHSFVFREVRLIVKDGSMRKLDDNEFAITPKPLVQEVSQSFIEETGRGFPLIPRIDKTISLCYPMDKLLSGEMSTMDLALIMPVNLFPKTKIRNHMVMHLLIPAGKRPFGNFKIKKITRKLPTN